MKLLVGYDGSECAEAALEDLQHAGLPATVDALVVSVASVWPASDDVRVDPSLPEWVVTPIEQAHAESRQAVQQMHAKATRASEWLRARFPTWTVHAEAVGHSPAWGIVKRADEWRPDLIVLGSQGHSTLGRFIMGSVSQRVLTAAHYSVRIARRGTGDRHAGRRLIVGVDGSTHAAAAVRAVKDRVWPQNAVVRVVSAFDAFMSTAVIRQHERILHWVEEGGEAETWIHKMVQAAVGELRTSGLNAEAMVREGDPKHVLVAEAEGWNADCIFVGAQGLNAFERFMLGSVSSAVAARAPCTVEVVRPRQMNS